MSRRNKSPVETSKTRNGSLTKKKQEYETNSDTDNEMEIQTKKTVKRNGSPKPKDRKIARIIERKAINTQALNKNKKPKLRKRTLTNKFADDDDEPQSDVEDVVFKKLARENDDLSEEEESEEDDDIHDTILNSNDSEENFCHICKNQKITKDQKNFKKHLSAHSKSIFISNWMKEHYKKCEDKDKFFCSKCFQQDQVKNNKNKKKVILDERSYRFGVKFPLKHLFEAHIEELRGHEKEFLKQINFFQMVDRKRKHFDQIVDAFEFTFENLKEYSRIYYSNTIQSKNKKKLLVGEMSYRLWDILKENKLPGKPNQNTMKIIEVYLQQKNQTTTTPGKSSLKKPSLPKDSEEDEKEEKEKEEDDNSPGQVDMPESSTIRCARMSQSSKRMGQDISEEDMIIKKVKEERDKYAETITKLTVEKYQKEEEFKEKIQNLETEHQVEMQNLRNEYKLKIQDLEKELAKIKLKVESA